QCRGELRLADGGGEVVELAVGVVAQVAERGRAVARQHVERIGERAAAVLAWFFSGADIVLQAVERELEAQVRDRIAAPAGAGEEASQIGIQPKVVAPGRPPPERAVRALSRHQSVDRDADALLGSLVERELRLARDLVDIEERQRLAGNLLGTAKRIAVERR